jgi:hypothetical protein
MQTVGKIQLKSFLVLLANLLKTDLYFLKQSSLTSFFKKASSDGYVVIKKFVEGDKTKQNG